MCYSFVVTEETKRSRGRPSTGVTPIRHLRVGALWDEAEAIAKRRNETMTDIVKPSVERALKRYINQHQGEAQ